jgi:hypothetical protein
MDSDVRQLEPRDIDDDFGENVDEPLGRLVRPLEQFARVAWPWSVKMSAVA